MNDKLATITNLFEGKEIRSVWDAEKEDYYFSVVDVINALAGPANPRDYWYQLKKRLSEEEKSEVSTNCRQLKIKAKDGKMRETDTLDTEGIFRLIESIPSPKAEPFGLADNRKVAKRGGGVAKKTKDFLKKKLVARLFLKTIL